MEQLISVVSKITVTRNEEDFIDRLNYRFTSYLFCFGSLLITSKLYLGTPIKCWTPAEFKKGWVQYTHDYCLIENTYYLPMNDPKMPGHDVREEEELPYYQWVQFVLVLLAFGFYLPHTFWRSVNWQSGVQVRSIISATTQFGLGEKEREEKINKVAAHIAASMESRKFGVANKSNPIMLIFGSCLGQHFLCGVYLLTKILFLVNILFQLFILHVFLGFTPLHFYDLGINTNWKNNGLFPRSTMCDFEVRTKGNVQRYSVQCVLQLNMFNEKIFVVLYYWLILLLAATVVNICMWIVNLFQASQRIDFARKMLKGAGIDQPGTYRSRNEKAQNSMELKDLVGKGAENEMNTYQSFVRMSPDTVLLLRLISSNAGDIAASDVTAALYRAALEDKQHSGQ